jgi:pyruvate/2-oxoglutarate dehydrogenase complex dihydrolipoamide dehydrogenase (E3) component
MYWTRQEKGDDMPEEIDRKKTRPEEFDLVILGGGTGSTIAAWTFAGQGQRVAVIDRKYIGGSCPNIACLPSKNVIHSAKVASYVRNSDRSDPRRARSRLRGHQVDLVEAREAGAAGDLGERGQGAGVWEHDSRQGRALAGGN